MYLQVQETLMEYETYDYKCKHCLLWCKPNSKHWEGKFIWVLDFLGKEIIKLADDTI